MLLALTEELLELVSLLRECLYEYVLHQVDMRPLNARKRVLYRGKQVLLLPLALPLLTLAGKGPHYLEHMAAPLLD
jgi:hypothetical protein